MIVKEENVSKHHVAECVALHMSGDNFTDSSTAASTALSSPRIAKDMAHALDYTIEQRFLDALGVSGAENLCFYFGDSFGILQIDFEREGLHWNEVQTNKILGAYFWVHWVSQIPGGILSKRYGTKLVFGGANFVVAVCSFLIPAAAFWGVKMLITLRIIQGFLAVSSHASCDWVVLTVTRIARACSGRRCTTWLPSGFRRMSEASSWPPIWAARSGWPSSTRSSATASASWPGKACSIWAGSSASFGASSGTFSSSIRPHCTRESTHWKRCIFRNRWTALCTTSGRQAPFELSKGLFFHVHSSPDEGPLAGNSTLEAGMAERDLAVGRHLGPGHDLDARSDVLPHGPRMECSDGGTAQWAAASGAHAVRLLLLCLVRFAHAQQQDEPQQRAQAGDGNDHHGAELLRSRARVRRMQQLASRFLRHDRDHGPRSRFLGPFGLRHWSQSQLLGSDTGLDRNDRLLARIHLAVHRWLFDSEQRMDAFIS